MNRQVSVDQLLQSATIKPEEAVAIVQQLIHGQQPRDLTPPLGPPTTATVFLAADGSVSCASSDAPFAVSELASLLDAMLPASGAPAVGVPGGLRYTIARARMEVDATPFDSVDDLSRALSRHERGDRAALVQRALARLNDTPFDRRRSDPAVTQLRRQLRDADARVYDQQRAIDALSVMAAKPPARNKRMAIAAGALIGLTFVGAGELMREHSTPASAGVRPPLESAPSPRVLNVRAAQPPPESAQAKATSTAKRPSRPAGASRDREQARPKRFQWLRSRFGFKSQRLS